MPLGYISRRLFHLLLIMVGVSVLVFLMLRMIPGDPARLLLGELASPDELARLRTQLGLDQSYLTQYAIYIKNLLMGDFGKSVRTSAPMGETLASALHEAARACAEACPTGALVLREDNPIVP